MDPAYGLYGPGISQSVWRNMEPIPGEWAVKALLTAITLSDPAFQHEAAAAFQLQSGLSPEFKTALGHRISGKAWNEAHEIIDRAEAAGVQIVTFFSALYPPLLRVIENPPLVLYVRGRLPAADDFSLAIVGSRRSSEYGRCAATKTAEELAARGIVIISGLARGIDSCAHQGALLAARRFGLSSGCAVLGSGVLRVYPPENEALAEALIERGGAVVSEFGLNAEPRRHFFPQRNRIVSGMSRAILVIEAGVRSGALITARLAAEQGREVFCLPGRIDSEESCGSNLLIRDGAQIFTSSEDILSRFKFTAEAQIAPPGQHRPETPRASVLQLLEKRTAVHFDELLEMSKLSPPELAALLSSLELEGSAFLRPGQYYSRHQFIDT